MFDAIDIIARVLGYGVIAFGVLKFTQMIIEDRRQTRERVARSKYESELLMRDPDAHRRLMEERNALDRMRHGLPIDPEVEQRIGNIVRSYRAAMEEADDRNPRL